MKLKANVLKQIEALSRGDLEVKRKLIGIFVFQTIDGVANIKAKNWSALKKEIHKLKSSFVHLNLLLPIALIKNLEIRVGENNKNTQKQVKELVVVCEE